MAKTWDLFDQTTSKHADYSEIVGVGDFKAKFHVGTSGLSRGVEMVTIDNGKLRFTVLPTRGMGLWKAWYNGDQEEHIGWHSPVRGPVHPSWVPLTEPGGLGWLDGFDELMVRCGLESNGAPGYDAEGRLKYPLHGRIANKPAYKLEVGLNDAGDEIRITGWVEETRFHFLKLRMKSSFTTKLDSTSIDVEDEITNISASPAEIQMLYHVNFGAPLLDAGSHVLCPAAEIVPRNAHAARGISNWNSYSAETPGFEEQVYFARLLADEQGNSQVLLKNAHATRGARLRFNVKQLPCFSVWKNTTANEDGFVTGIEPGTNFPNPREFEGEHGRTLKLDAKSTVSLTLGIDYLADEINVDRAARAIAQLQSAAPTVHPSPLVGWCAP